MIRELMALALGFKAAEIRFQPDWLRAPTMELSFGNLVREGYRKNSAVYSCIRAHAQAFPEPPLVVKRKTGRGQDIVDGHPMVQLLERPNPFMGQGEFWAFVVTWMAVGGNCYVWKRRNVAGQAMELWPLHDGLIRPRLDASNWISGYVADAGDGNKVAVPIEDIVHLRWAPDPLTPQSGIGPVVAVAREVDTDNEAARYIHALLKNDAVPRTLVTVRNGLTDSAFKRLKSQFREQYGGSRRGDVMVLEGQEMSIDRLGLNLNELADAALRRVPETRISGAFEVPAILAGLGSGLESATYSNAGQLREYFTETTLIPRWRSVASQFQVQLLPEFGAADGLVVEFDLSQVRALAGDEDAKWTRWRGAWTDGIATLNETRVALGMEPTKFGDVFLRGTGSEVVSVDKDPTEVPETTPTAGNASNRVPSTGGDGRTFDDGTVPRALPAAPRPEAPARNADTGWEVKGDVAERLAILQEAGVAKIATALEAALGEAFENVAETIAHRVAEGRAQVVDGDGGGLAPLLTDGRLAAFNQAVLDAKSILGGSPRLLAAKDVDLTDTLDSIVRHIARDAELALQTAQIGAEREGLEAVADRAVGHLMVSWMTLATELALSEATTAYREGLVRGMEAAETSRPPADDEPRVVKMTCAEPY